MTNDEIAKQLAKLHWQLVCIEQELENLARDIKSPRPEPKIDPKHEGEDAPL